MCLRAARAWARGPNDTAAIKKAKGVQVEQHKNLVVSDGLDSINRAVRCVLLRSSSGECRKVQVNAAASEERRDGLVGGDGLVVLATSGALVKDNSTRMETNGRGNPEIRLLECAVEWGETRADCESRWQRLQGVVELHLDVGVRWGRENRELMRGPVVLNAWPDEMASLWPLDAGLLWFGLWTPDSSAATARSSHRWSFDWTASTKGGALRRRRTRVCLVLLPVQSLVLLSMTWLSIDFCWRVTAGRRHTGRKEADMEAHSVQHVARQPRDVWYVSGTGTAGSRYKDHQAWPPAMPLPPRPSTYPVPNCLPRPKYTSHLAISREAHMYLARA